MNQIYIAQQSLEYTLTLDNLHKPNKKNRVTKSKTLFIEVEQTSITHLYSVCSNYLTALWYMYVDPTATVQYKHTYLLFPYWLNDCGKNDLIYICARTNGLFTGYS